MKKIIENGVTILIADNGKILTNGDVVGNVVRLGVNDSETNWYETDEADEELTDSEALDIIVNGGGGNA